MTAKKPQPFAEIGRRISDLRGRRSAELREDITQAVLATRVGVTRETLGKWEAGMQRPTGLNLQRLAEELGVTTRYITDGSDALSLPKQPKGGSVSVTPSPAELILKGHAPDVVIRLVDAETRLEIERASRLRASALADAERRALLREHTPTAPPADGPFQLGDPTDQPEDGAA